MKSNVIYGFHILAGGFFVAAGGAKLAGVDIMVQEFDLVGLGQSFRILVGSVEIIGGLCLVVPRAGVLGATLVACTVAGFLSAAIACGVALASRPNPTSGPLLTIYKSSPSPAGWARRGDAQRSRHAVPTNARDIQSFVFNVFGAVDNLAWIWMAENGQKRGDGTPIPDTHIGLGPKNESVRGTLSQELRDYLKTLDAWFRYLADLRHPLAHRIPLYIPPYVIETKDESAYRNFEAKMGEAAKKGDFKEYDRLSTEQLRLGRFRPWVQHSFEENAKPVVFHAQMLADFNTVDELAHKMLGEFARFRAT